MNELGDLEVPAHSALPTSCSFYRMLPWYNFVQSEDAEPEVCIGPFECYIEERGYGPSALDRAMTHTLMLQLDHERRFAVSQLGIDCSTFATDHCANVTRAIDCALERFDSCHSQPEAVRCTADSFDLIGLRLVSTPVDYLPSLPDIRQDYVDTFVVKSSVADRSEMLSLGTKTTSDPVVREKSPIIVVDDDVDEDAQSQEEIMKTLQQWCREKRKLSETHPRNYSLKRARRPIDQANSEEHIRGSRRKYVKTRQ